MLKRHINSACRKTLQFCRLQIFFNSIVLKVSHGNTIRLQKQFGPKSVGSDLGPNCLQILSAGDSGKSLIV